MLGVVLCGGESTRMGKDKGLMPCDDDAYSWAGTAFFKLAALQIPVVLSVNERQIPAYTAQFPKEQLILDSPDLTLKGPLAGILSVHRQYPAEDLFVLACDLPHMHAAILQTLHSRYTTHKAAQAYVFTANEEHEPLCAIYTAAGLATIACLHQSQQLNRHSMKYALAQLNVHSLPIPENLLKYFENCNYPPGPADD